jgi:hypothetical protein
MKFIQKQIEFEAMQFDGNNANEILEMFNHKPYEGRIYFYTPKGILRADPGQWIFRGPGQVLGIINDESFRAVFQEVE